MCMHFFFLWPWFLSTKTNLNEPGLKSQWALFKKNPNELKLFWRNNELKLSNRFCVHGPYDMSHHTWHTAHQRATGTKGYSAGLPGSRSDFIFSRVDRSGTQYYGLQLWCCTVACIFRRISLVLVLTCLIHSTYSSSFPCMYTGHGIHLLALKLSRIQAILIVVLVP